MSITKHIINGSVAVIVSPGHGAGWATWATDAHYEAMAMDARLVTALLEGGRDELARVASEMFPDVYTGGARDAVVMLVPQGKQFRIEEYDGYESLVFADEDKRMLTA